MAQSKPNWIGHSLSGRYRIDTLLGQGGMSAVYRAYDPNLHRVVAVKLIHSHLATDPQFVQRFEQEAGAVAALRHPHIVQVFDFNHDGDTYYMVMEYVEGESLHSRLRTLHRQNQLLPIAETVDLLATISAAVGFAHQQGLVHRDLKPANIMLNPAGQPILMDFGVVKIVGGQQHTATGVVVGTPMYVAPELVRGKKFDARSDIYSLGVMLFEMLAGRPPFEADTAMALMIKHVREPVPDIRALQPDVPVSVARIVEQALAKDPNERFQSAGDFANALRSAHLAPRPPRPVASTGAWAPTDAAMPAPAVPAAGSRRGLLLLGCGGLLVLALLGSAAAAAVAMNAFTQARPTPTATATATTALATASPTEADTDTPAPSATVAVVASATLAPASPTNPPPSPTPAPPTRTLAPLFTLTPTITPTPPPTATEAESPTPTATQALAASITGISIVNDRYAVSFATEGYVPMLPGQHLHFFFDTVPPAQAGSPGGGPWIIHAAQPNPFTGYAVADRPSAATQMCVLVANPNHTVIANSGNCWPLP